MTSFITNLDPNDRHQENIDYLLSLSNNNGDEILYDDYYDDYYEDYYE